MTSSQLSEKFKWGKVLESGIKKFFKGCLPQNLHSSLLNILSQVLFW